MTTVLQLPAVNFSFYATESIGDFHRLSLGYPTYTDSGVYGLMKLLTPATLSLLHQLSKVIVLDTDVTVVNVCDYCHVCVQDNHFLN